MTFSNPKVSVIMPVYNQELYLEKALRSIANQTFKDFELIIVNDGSTDDSAIIIDEFCLHHPNYLHIKKTNGGVASARQLGFENSKGEYLIQIDPDDWVEPDYLEKLVTEAESSGAEMVVCNYIKEYTDHNVLVNVYDFHVAEINEFKLCLANEKIWGVGWNKLIKLDLIKNRIKFLTDINFQEDLLFIYQALNKVKKVSFIKDYLYHYNRQNLNSAVYSQNLKTLQQAWNNKRIILELEPDIEFRKKIKRNLIDLYNVLYILRHKGLTSEDKSKILSGFQNQIKIKALKTIFSLSYKKGVKIRVHSVTILRLISRL